MTTSHDTEGAVAPDVFEWRPADLIRAGPRAGTPHAGDQAPGFALVVLNQPLHTHLGVVRRLWDNGVFILSCMSSPTKDDKIITDGPISSNYPRCRRWWSQPPV
jgi:thiamine pyrophosphokinase